MKADGDAGDISTDSVTARRRIKGNIGMVYLAGLLANMVDRPVVDETGIKGVYRIDLVWSEDGSTDSSAAEDFPSLFTALRSTLGLILPMLGFRSLRCGKTRPRRAPDEGLNDAAMTAPA